jgi:hypothetical protein
MRQSLTCPRCAGQKIWNLRDACEHSHDGPRPLGEPQSLDPIELFMCAACGYAQWFAAQPRSLRPSPGATIVELSDHRMICGCGEREHLLIARFEEVELSRRTWVVPLAVFRERGVPAGSFAVTACRSCGRMSWFACELPSIAPNLEGACRRCRAARMMEVKKVEEIGGHKLPLVLRESGEIGQFRLELCLACGYTDWFGERYAKLHANGRDVLILEGKGTRDEGPRNPYR